MSQCMETQGHDACCCNEAAKLFKSILSCRCFCCCRSGTYFCVDKSVTAVVIAGLAEHKDTLGAPLCPCRHYDDKEAEAAQGFWNCPCVPMRERKVS
jgi:hypothetical protein